MKAEKQEARQLTDVERKRIREREEATFRELRLFLRDVINKLGRDRKFAIFAKPVDVTEVTTPCLIKCFYQDLSGMPQIGTTVICDLRIMAFYMKLGNVHENPFLYESCDFSTDFNIDSLSAKIF